MSIYDYPPMPSAVWIPPVVSTRTDVLGRGLRLGVIAGMCVAAGLAAVPCLFLLFFAGIGLPILLAAVALGALVGLIEGLIEAVSLWRCRHWIGRNHSRAGLVGVLAVAIIPAGLAVVAVTSQSHSVPILEWIGAFTVLAGTVAAVLAGRILWNATERAGRSM